MGPELFCLLPGPLGFNCWFSFVPVVLFDTPGISRCWSQNVSVEPSSLFNHSIYLWFICFPWWFIDELENLHADRTTVCFEPWQKPRARFKLPSILILTVPRRSSVVVPYCYLFLLSVYSCAFCSIWILFYFMAICP